MEESRKRMVEWEIRVTGNGRINKAILQFKNERRQGEKATVNKIKITLSCKI